MFVCHCRALTDGEIREVITAGASDLDQVGDRCGAGITCGGCCPLIEELLARHADGGRGASGPGLRREPLAASA
jgi:bacterioferritin-associated ferredoxin